MKALDTSNPDTVALAFAPSSDATAPSVPTGVAAAANGTTRSISAGRRRPTTWGLSAITFSVTANATAIATGREPATRILGCAPGLDAHLHRLRARRAPERIGPVEPARIGNDRRDCLDDVHPGRRFLCGFVRRRATSAPAPPCGRRHTDLALVPEVQRQRADGNGARTRRSASSRTPTHTQGYDVFSVANTSWIESGAGSITFNNVPAPAATKTGSSGPSVAAPGQSSTSPGSSTATARSASPSQRLARPLCRCRAARAPIRRSWSSTPSGPGHGGAVGAVGGAGGCERYGQDRCQLDSVDLQRGGGRLSRVP